MREELTRLLTVPAVARVKMRPINTHKGHCSDCAGGQGRTEGAVGGAGAEPPHLGRKVCDRRVAPEGLPRALKLGLFAGEIEKGGGPCALPAEVGRNSSGLSERAAEFAE